MLRRPVLPLLLCLAAANAACGPALAMQPTEPAPPAERTGPNARQPTPDFATPPEPPSLRSDAVPQNMPAPGGSVTLSGIETSEGTGDLALVHGDWSGIDDPLNNLSVRPGPSGLLDSAWVASQFAANSLIGSEAGLERISAMVQLINRAFIANGYINSGVLIDGLTPDSRLRLRLVSGRIVGPGAGEPGLTVTWSDGGSDGLSVSYIRSRMPTAQHVPLNAIDIERDFRLLAEDPAIGTINADLRPGSRPGEAQLALTVEPQRRFDVYLSAANDRSPSIGGERYAIGGSLRNGLTAGDLFTIEAGLVGNRGDVIAGYEAPLFGPRTRLLLRGGYNDAAVIDPQLRPLNIEASDWHVEGGVARILLRDPLTPRGDGSWAAARTFTIGAHLTHRQSTSSLLGRRFSFSPGAVNGRAEYTALRLTADYLQRGVNSVFAVSLIGTQGFEGTRSRFPGLISPDEDFRSIRAQLSFARRLGDNGWELRARLAGQWADGILYSGERFSVGGQQTVRGYRETLILSDTGANGSVELLHRFSLSGRSGGGTDWGAFAISAFADGAIVHNREGGQPIAGEIGSVGASFAWTPNDAIFAQLTYAHALNDVPQVGRRDIQDRGFHFRVTIRPLALLGLAR